MFCMFFLVSLGQWHYELTPFLITNLQNGFIFSFSPCEHRKTSHQFCESSISFVFLMTMDFTKDAVGLVFFPWFYHVRCLGFDFWAQEEVVQKLDAPKISAAPTKVGPSLDRWIFSESPWIHMKVGGFVKGFSGDTLYEFWSCMNTNG